MLNLGIAALALWCAQQPAGNELTLTAAAEKGDAVLGEDVQIEVVLTNAGDKPLEVSELVFELRSVSFETTFEAAPGKAKTFLYSVSRPDPHVVDRTGPAKVSLKPKKSLNALFRVPTLRTGPLTLAAVYRGGEKEVKAPPLSVKVAAQADGASRLAALVSTSMGDFQIDLLPEEAPNGVANFVALAKRGFYANMNFHHIVKGGWVHTGCPYDNGFGHAGWAIKSELDQSAVYEPGTVGLSQNMKSGYTGSQFFVTVDRQSGLDKKFPILGRVPESKLDVVKKIGNLEPDRATGRPKEDVRMKDLKIVVVK